MGYESLKIGILCMQGAFAEHKKSIERLKAKPVEVRTAADLDGIDGIILPGGESTAIGKLIRELGIKEKLQNMIKAGLPVWGTCAGMILIAQKISESDVIHMPLMDIEVVRNAYGRQLGSFAVDAQMKGIEGQIQMVFIRAPYIREASGSVDVLSVVDGNIVAARQGNMLVTSFHPELTHDDRVHGYFVEMVNEYRKS